MSSSDGLFVSIDGPSGVGKSTTAQALAQLMRSEGGSISATAGRRRSPTAAPAKTRGAAAECTAAPRCWTS